MIFTERANLAGSRTDKVTYRGRFAPKTYQQVGRETRSKARQRRKELAYMILNHGEIHALKVVKVAVPNKVNLK